MAGETARARGSIAVPAFPRDVRGRAISRACPDPNCGGRLVWDPDVPGTAHYVPGGGAFRCDGLTHERDDGPLVACDYTVLLPADEKWAAARLEQARAAR